MILSINVLMLTSGKSFLLFLFHGTVPWRFPKRLHSLEIDRLMVRYVVFEKEVYVSPSLHYQSWFPLFTSALGGTRALATTKSHCRAFLSARLHSRYLDGLSIAHSQIYRMQLNGIPTLNYFEEDRLFLTFVFPSRKQCETCLLSRRTFDLTRDERSDRLADHALAHHQHISQRVTIRRKRLKGKLS